LAAFAHVFELVFDPSRQSAVLDGEPDRGTNRRHQPPLPRRNQRCPLESWSRLAIESITGHRRIHIAAAERIRLQLAGIKEPDRRPQAPIRLRVVG
jgi:hypothetical protein